MVGQMDTEWVMRENKSQELLLVNLPDGSSVLLSKESSLRLSASKTKPNESDLDGEGFLKL